MWETRIYHFIYHKIQINYSLNTMNIKHEWLKTVLTITSLLLVLPSYAEQTGANPEINQPFINTDFQQWINIFESPGREVFDQRHAIVAASKAQPGMDIADIGAGTGFFTRLFAPKVEPDGTVYAIDISKSFIDNILRTCKEQSLSNVKGIVNTHKDLGMPANSIDLAFITDTYHHFEHPKQTLASIHKALRKNGRVIIIDFRRDPHTSSNWVMQHVRGNKQQVIQELQDAGFTLLDDKALLKTNYFLEFVKSEDN